MKGFLILLVLGYAGADKLDLTYLPPPGSQYSGGGPEDIQVPLEYPKETYSTTFKPQTTPVSYGGITPEDYQATIGINRGLPPQNQNVGSGGQIGSISNVLNSNKLPTTTISYAFTQTTTHPPSESFETTINPINLASGFPVPNSFNEPSLQGLGTYEKNKNAQNRPSSTNYNSVDQFGQLQPTNEPLPGTIQQNSHIPAQSQVAVFNQNRPGQPETNIFNQFQQGYQQPSSFPPVLASQAPFGQNQYVGNQSVIGNILPQRAQSNYQPGTSLVTIPQSYTSAPPNIPQSDFVDRKYTQSRIPTSSTQTVPAGIPNTGKYFIQQQPGSSSNNDFRRLNGTYRPSSTASPLGSSTSIPNQEYSTDSSSGPNRFYSTPAYSEVSSDSVASTKYRDRPERLQAQSDRNAVILNYDNVRTPDGYYAYSFDTSNGIHADESGDANGGVKAKGSYSYTGDDGKIYTVVYTADENGFRPQGSHLPTPPPVPEAIQRIIDNVKQEKEAGIYHDGFYDEEKYGNKKFTASTAKRPQGFASLPVDENDSLFDNESGQQNFNRQYGLQGKKEEPALPSDYNSFTKQVKQEFSDGSVPKQISDYSLLHPGSHIQEKDSGNILNSNLSTGRSDTLATKQPYNEGTRKQYHPENSSSDINNVIRNEEIRRPITTTSSFFPEKHLQQQIVDGTAFSRPVDNQNQGNIKGYKDSENSRRYYNEESSRRPINRLEMQNNQQYIKKSDSRKEIIRPTSRPIYGVEKPSNFEKTTIENVKQPVENLPFSYSPKEELQDVGDQYRLNNNVPYQQSLRNQLSNTSGPVNEPQTYEDQTISTSRQLAQADFKDNKAGNNLADFKYGPTTAELLQKSTKVDYVPTDNYGFRKIIGNKQLPSTTDVRDRIPEQYFSENVRQQIPSQQPKVGSISSTDRREQSTLVNKLPNLEVTSSNEPSLNERQNNIGRLSYNQRTEISRNKNPSSRPIEESGYQYTPPQTRFTQGGQNTFPFRLTGTELVSNKEKPQFPDYSSKDTSVKPFITPNVSRVDKNNSEEYDEEQFIPDNINIPQDNIKQNYGEEYTSVSDPQYPSTETTPAQVSDNELISSIRPPSYSTKGSTYRPVYDRITGKPTLQYSSTPSYNNIPKGTITPYPTEDNRKYEQNGLKSNASYNGVSSTMPTPSGTRYYGSTQPDTLVPGSETYFNGVTNGPVQPSQGSRVDSYPQNIKTKYETYRPLGNIRPTTGYNDRTIVSRLPNAKPTVSITTNAPFGYSQGMQFGDRIPSSTYGPNVSFERNQPPSPTPGLQVDRFGRPINNQEGNRDQQYRNGPPRDSLGRPVYEETNVQYPNDFSRGFNQQTGSIIQPSTESIIGEDFSGPKQPQTFDPETGYHYK